MAGIDREQVETTTARCAPAFRLQDSGHNCDYNVRLVKNFG